MYYDSLKLKDDSSELSSTYFLFIILLLYIIILKHKCFPFIFAKMECEVNSNKQNGQISIKAFCRFWRRPWKAKNRISRPIFRLICDSWSIEVGVTTRTKEPRSGSSSPSSGRWKKGQLESQREREREREKVNLFTNPWRCQDSAIVHHHQ